MQAMELPHFATFAAAVLQFREAFHQNPTIQLSAQLLCEESMEVLEATDALREEFSVENVEAFIKEVADFFYVATGFMIDGEAIVQAGEEPDLGPAGIILAVVLPEAAEHIRAAMRCFLTEDMLLQAFDRVHASNMSKLGPDGQPIFNEAGKVMKGSFYQPPRLTDLAQEALDRFAVHMLAAMMEAA